MPQPILPTPPERYDRAFMSRLVEAIRQGFLFTVGTETATSSVMLLSPGGKVYRVTVDDTGTLTTTYVSG